MGNSFLLKKCNFENFILNDFLAQTEKDMADPFHNMTPAFQQVNNMVLCIYVLLMCLKIISNIISKNNLKK